MLSCGIAVMAVIGPIAWHHDAEDLTATLMGGPSWAHPLGTDALGRDVLARTLVATRLTVVMAAITTIIAIGGGLLLGAGIVLAPRWIRTVGERAIDGLLAYPPIIVALTVTAIFQPSVESVTVAIGLAFIPQAARLSNNLAASIGGRDYIAAAELLGLRPFRLLRRHIVPNHAGPLLVLTSVGFASAIIALSGLSFIGLGVQDPSYDWGKLLTAGLQDLSVNPIEVVGPGLCIMLTGMAAGLVGDGLTRQLDPRRASVVNVERAGPGVVGVPALSDWVEDEHEEVRADAAVTVRNLRITNGAGVPLLSEISLHVGPGEIVGLVGESGSGKTLTALSIARLLPQTLRWEASALMVNGSAANGSDQADAKRLAIDLGIVFQDPGSCFNPARHVGPQLTEVVRVHTGLSKRQANALAIDRLREVRVSSPALRMRQYPHELSGGMRRRAMIAMALMTSPGS